MLRCQTCGRDYPSDVQFCPVDQSALQPVATVQADATDDPLIGQTLDGKYRLEQQLGSGGMGTVYRARNLPIDRAVAVKVLNQRLFADEAARARFQREAKAAGRLQHINAVTVIDFGHSADGYPYLVMELLEGRNLRAILAKEAPLETARAVSLMLQASAAVTAAHDAGVIHRDLKPANIFVTQSLNAPSIVKVLDFGIAKVVAETLDDDEPGSISRLGAMVGTPRYMSPEQCNGIELTPAADVYSLGVILYELLTGTVPFSGSSPAEIAIRQTSEYPRPPKELVAAIPDDLERVVLHALEKDPSERPANAAEFRSELLQVAEKLGLEHHALISSPDITALRGVGVESPSGRLVVDLSRLREGRVLTAGGVEAAASREQAHAAGDSSQGMKVGFRRTYNGRLVVAGMILFALLVSGIIFFAGKASRSKVPAVDTTNADPLATPIPSLTPLASPSATLQPSPSLE